MNKKIYTDYIRDILNSIDEIETFVKEMSFEEFIQDKKTVNAVIRSLEVIGEAAKNIPELIRIKHVNIPWKKMAGMRDKLIHEYFGVNLEIIWQTIQEDIPQLEASIKKLKKSLEQQS